MTESDKPVPDRDAPPWWYRGLGGCATFAARCARSRRMGPWPRADSPTLWLHAASVGEAKGIASLLPYLGPDAALTLTATTEAGRLRLERSGHPSFLLPLDHGPVVDEFLQRRRIGRALFLESEAWPATLRKLSETSVPVAFAAFRTDSRALARWRRFGSLFPGWTSGVDAVWTDLPENVQAVRRLGFRNVSAGGILKWIGDPTVAPSRGTANAAISFHMRDLPTLRRLREDFPDQGWHWLPRRPDRIRLHAAWARICGLDPVDAAPGPGQVRISATFGETEKVLAECARAWVSPGHDLLEPRLHGIEEVWTGRPPHRTTARTGCPEEIAREIAAWLRGTGT